MISICEDCLNKITINGEDICLTDDIPFSGCVDDADETGECPFYRSRKERDDADNRLL